MPLKLVPETPAPPLEKLRQRIKAHKPPEMLQCRCGCRDMIEIKTGVLFKDGKPNGGTKQLLCAACFQKGERRVIA